MKRKKEAKKEKMVWATPMVLFMWASPLWIPQFKGMGYAHGCLFFRFWKA
ncbi:MAG TPA: hypothetical protein VFX43_07260 [Chitinophagaceae bacterium]|nr:hypothetical protein [Chitinophagaceae bacterium]